MSDEIRFWPGDAFVSRDGIRFYRRDSPEGQAITAAGADQPPRLRVTLISHDTITLEAIPENE